MVDVCDLCDVCGFQIFLHVFLRAFFSSVLQYFPYVLVMYFQVFLLKTVLY